MGGGSGPSAGAAPAAPPLSPSPPSPRPYVLPLAAVAALLAAAVWLAYSSVLDNFFFYIDDPTLLWSSARWIPATPHFRLLYTPWNHLLWAGFGLEPFGWYLVGMVAHVVGATLLAVLVRRLTGSWLRAAVTALLFALFYGSHEVVFWIAANSTLMSVVLLIAAALSWDVFLTSEAERPVRRGAAYAAAFVLLVLSAGFKEDCVLGGPLFLGLDLLRNGRRGVLSWEALRRYAPFALFAAVYLGYAFQPGLWADLPTVGRYELELVLIPELFRNFAWLAWPRHFDPDTLGWVSSLVGLLLAAAIGIAGWHWRRREPLVLFGLAVALLGMLPALPGPFPIAGSRYGYAGSIGASLILGTVFAALWRWRSAATWRALLLGGTLGWLAANGYSIHSTEEWRFGANCARLERMVATSGPVVEQAGTSVIYPVTPNSHDYVHALCLWHGLEPRDVESERIPHGTRLLERLRPGGDLDPTTHRVFACRKSGEVFRMHSPADALVALWAEEAARRQREGKSDTLPLVRVLRAARATGAER